MMEQAAPILQGCRVRINIDNLSLAFGLGGVVTGFEAKAYGGSRIQAIQEIIVAIFDLCVQERVTLTAVWVPRSLNEKADYLSKMTDHYDFALSRLLFAKVDARWGPHTINRFSSAKSVLVKSGRFNSRFWQPREQGCMAIDAFSQDWAGEVNWVHPPYRLVGKALAHMLRNGAQGTIVVPQWEKAAWWPMVSPEEGVWAHFVVNTIYLGKSVGKFKGQRTVGALVVGKNTAEDLAQLPVADMWALRIDGSFV
jgi:hypothetical protein